MSRLAGSSGSADAIGIVLIAPVMVGVGLLLTSIGDRVDAVTVTRSAAWAGAQAAVRERSPDLAGSAARSAASTSLVGDHSSSLCDQPSIDVDLSEFRPGGRVAVMVDCDGPAGSRYTASTATATIDRFRESSVGGR
jgi:hypothetical protein